MNAGSNWLKKSTQDAKASLKHVKTPEDKPVPHSGPLVAKPLLAPPPKGPLSLKYIRLYEAQKKSSSVVKLNLSAGEQALVDVVAAEIASAPYEHFDQVWAARPMAGYSEQLGVSERQVSRRVRAIPLVWRQAIKDGVKLTLLRTGEPADKTPYDFAQMMAAEFRKRTGRAISPAQFGSLVFFAKEVVPEWSVDIFCTILDDWGGFMAAVKVAITDGMSGIDPHCKDPEKFFFRYFQYPAIHVIRRFPYVARDYFLYRMKDEAAWQAEKKPNGIPKLQPV
jgi:hypothetical protein